jgi:RNA polymerase sigma factor (sigma-70 family)
MSEAPATRPSLLVRLRDSRDEQAWAEFVAIYDPLIFKLARQRGLQDADAADLVQEVFRAVAVAVSRYDPNPAKGSFRGWLSTIARNLIVNLLRTRKRQPQGSGQTEIVELLEEQPAPVCEESAIFDEEYRRSLLTWAVDRIRDEFAEPAWQAFFQTAVEGRPPKDVASSLGMTLGTVYQYKSRVVARLRREIARVEGNPEELSPGD